MQNRQNRQNQAVKKLLLFIIVVLLFANLIIAGPTMRNINYLREVSYGRSITPQPVLPVQPGQVVPGISTIAAPEPNAGLTNGIIIQEEPAVIVATGEPPAYEPSVPVVAPALPQDTTNQAAAVYAADPERVQACMDAAVAARRSSPGCAELLRALGGGR